MKLFEYTSLPGSETQIKSYIKGKKFFSIVIPLVSLVALVAVVVSITFNSEIDAGQIQIEPGNRNLQARLKQSPQLAKRHNSKEFLVTNKDSDTNGRTPSENSSLVGEDSAEEKIPYNFVQRGQSLVVQTNEGLVEGTTLESRAGRKYVAFYKIPYAAPPLGPLRFKLPEPPKSWEGIREAKKPGLECIQPEKYAPVLRSAGEEDCLYLNIYTPKLPTIISGTMDTETQPKLPVMFYIHGGGFNSGNGTRYGPDYFMDEDVIIITYEFRLGAFGFISTGDMEIRGNMGLKDTIQALRWVQKNIAAFGGDPNKVTVFGNSGGSIITHALLLSHMSKGLFHRAICQSGTAIAQGGGVLPFPPKLITLQIANKFGCNPPNSTTREMVDCLRKVDAKELAIVESPTIVFAPAPEPIPEDGDLSNVFYSRPPYEIMNDAENYPMRVPWIIGDVSGEELLGTLERLKNPEVMRDLNEDWVNTITKTLPFKHRPSDEKLMSIKEFYFGHIIKRRISNHTRFELLNMYTDHKWTHVTKLAVLAHAKHSPVFLYWLTKEAAKSYAEKNMGGFSPPFGVQHADELQYFFLYDGYPEIPIGSPYTNFSQKLVHNWVNFAATGTPALQDWTQIDPTKNGTVWYRLDEDEKSGMTSMLKKRIRFWEDFTYELLG